ncbi:conserved hypothetical protein [Gammaproteobacteria bacterium]
MSKRKNTTPNEDALEAFVAKTHLILAKLALLQDRAEEHFGQDPDSIHWGHVGDLTRIDEGLDEVMAIVKG